MQYGAASTPKVGSQKSCHHKGVDCQSAFSAMTHTIIYDGTCNLCVTLVQLLETLDQGDRFQYVPMQDQLTLDQFGITAADCELGMILLDSAAPEQRWQGSAAAEQIGQMFPTGQIFVSAYRALPGLKWAGDRIYEQVRDNRYTLFGKRDTTYTSHYGCNSSTCKFADAPISATYDKN